MSKENIISIYGKNIREAQKELLKKEIPLDPKVTITIKNTILKDSPNTNDYKIMCDSLRKIIEMNDISIDTFCANYSTKYLKALHISKLIKGICDNAPEELKYNCYYVTKRIVFASVWPDYYLNNFLTIKCVDIFYAKGEIKAALTHNAHVDYDKTLKNLMNDKNSTSAAAKNNIDTILYNTFYEMFNVISELSFVDSLKILANYEQALGKTPSIFHILEARTNYACPLDFYFLNSPVKDQIRYFDDYMEIRKQAGIPENSVLNKIYNLYRNNKEYFNDKTVFENTNVKIVPFTPQNTYSIDVTEFVIDPDNIFDNCIIFNNSKDEKLIVYSKYEDHKINGVWTPVLKLTSTVLVQDKDRTDLYLTSSDAAYITKTIEDFYKDDKQTSYI